MSPEQDGPVEWARIAELPSITAEGDDLEIVELCQGGLAGSLQLTVEGIEVVGKVPSFVIRDVEATPLLLGTHQERSESPRSMIVGTQVLRQVDPLVPLAQRPDLAVVVQGPPSQDDLRRIETLSHGDMRIVWVVPARRDRAGLRLVAAVSEVVGTFSRGDHSVVRLAWPRSDGQYLKKPRLPESAAVAWRFGAPHYATVGLVGEPSGFRVDRGGTVVFFTGLSGSGKSTVAKALRDAVVVASDRAVTLLDGDDVRRMLSAELGFDDAGRAANVRRVSWVAALIAESGGLAITALIAPSSAIRAEARRMALKAGADFMEVWVSTPLEECERRDRKGLYAMARAGKIPNFTGIDSPYEAPSRADLVVDTSVDSIENTVATVIRELEHRAVRRGTEPLMRGAMSPYGQEQTYEI